MLTSVRLLKTDDHENVRRIHEYSLLEWVMCTVTVIHGLHKTVFKRILISNVYSDTSECPSFHVLLDNHDHSHSHCMYRTRFHTTEPWRSRSYGLSRVFLSIFWPIRMDHTVFHKWLIKQRNTCSCVVNFLYNCEYTVRTVPFSTTNCSWFSTRLHVQCVVWY